MIDAWHVKIYMARNKCIYVLILILLKLLIARFQ